MSEGARSESPRDATLQTLRLIAFALASQPVVFAVMVAVLAAQGIPSVPEGGSPFHPLLLYVALGVTIADMALSFVIKPRVIEAASKGAGPAAACAGYRAATIVAMALNEGGALLALAGALLTHRLELYLPVALIACVGMILHFPSEAAMDEAIRSRSGTSGR